MLCKTNVYEQQIRFKFSNTFFFKYVPKSAPIFKSYIEFVNKGMFIETPNQPDWTPHLIFPNRTGVRSHKRNGGSSVTPDSGWARISLC